jgi:hypothetical protein
LTRYIDADLASWLERWTEIDTLLNEPQLLVALDKIGADPGVHLDR